jgi:hypothetical protein
VVLLSVGFATVADAVDGDGIDGFVKKDAMVARAEPP